MEQAQKQTLVRIVGSAALLLLAVLLPLTGPARLLIFLLPYGLIGGDVLWHATRNLLRGAIFDEHFLMSLATLGAFAIGEYPEAVFVMLFYQIGELFQDYAVDRSRKSITALMDIRPDYANLERDGALTQVPPDTVAPGEIIVLKPGERIPLDGVVLEGSSALDTAALTGEALPRAVCAGEDVLSGCVNLTGVLRVRVSKAFGASTVSKILDLVENASAKKGKAEQFITRFARIYTPIVVIAAALLAILPPLLWGWPWSAQLHNALIFLVISCPCALVISVPLSFFGGIGGASRCGILVKGGNYLEALARVETVVFDKTGTLTQGHFAVTAVHPQALPGLLEYAALAECYSDHPISRSLRAAWGGVPDKGRVTHVAEVAGRGVRAQVDGKTVCAGNGQFMETLGVAWHDCHLAGTAVHVAVDGVYAGHIIIADQIKPDAADAIRALKALGVRKTVMLTGDTQAVAASVAQALGLDEVHAALLPGDKVAQVEALLRAADGQGKLAFVGDGINDAPVLARADVGIAMGGLGADAAIEAADVVLMDDSPAKIADAIRIARKTVRIVRQNIVFALGVKLLFLALGALGQADLWWAVFADVGVSVLATLNAMRAMRVAR